MAAEYERLGRPLDQADLNPDHIVEFVGQHFSAGATSSFADPPRPPSASASGMPSASLDGQPLEDMSVFYVLSNDPHMGWQLHAIAIDGQVVQEVTLPDPGPGQFYSMLYSGGEFAVQRLGQQPVPCADLMAGGFDPVAEAAAGFAEFPLALPPGVAPHSAMLPGMTPHQPTPPTGQGVDWVINS